MHLFTAIASCTSLLLRRPYAAAVVLQARAIGCILVACSTTIVSAQDSSATVANEATLSVADTEFFESKIRPVLVEHCYSCHAADSKIIRGGLLVDSRNAIRSGGDSGPAVVPGDTTESLILAAMRHESYEMPPERKLPDAVIADFEQWIVRGAPDPRDHGNGDAPKGVDWQAAESHWAFQPIDDPQPPAVTDSVWIKNPIDQFILARLEAAGMRPTPTADKETLIRRATFDLIGLPPTIKEVNEFLADDSPSAFAKVVDRLLESPHYGERWGRHWLDLVRYADTNGADENHALPNAWHYRDWVIRMINRDLPLDDFIVHQLAGDLLPKTGIEATDGDLITATGMLIIGPKMLAEQDKDKMIIDIVDEQIDTISRTLLGLTIGCSRCHDHKFDPISAKDYYALAGIFYSTQTMADRAFVSKWLERPLPSQEIEARRALHQVKIDDAKALLTATQSELKIETEKLASLKAQQPDPTAASDPSGDLPGGASESEPTDAPEQSLTALIEKQTAIVETVKQKAESQKKAVETVEKEMPSFVMVMAANEAQPANLPIHIRGNHLALSETKIDRGVPEILTRSASPAKIADDQSGRLQLAHWLVSPNHPLTSRVMANRVWMWHFGQALVRTPSNFGLRADQPTHPELLDYLASRWLREGWSLKRMHRLIMTSATYQMSSDIDFSDSIRYAEQDPDNRLWWRRGRRRLEAEPVRDAILAVGGGLDMKLGGTAPNTNSDRRAVYIPINRAALYEMFSTFDYVETANHIEQRPTTTVPHQALFLLNSPIVHKQATEVAKQAISQTDDSQLRVDAIFRLLYSRPPTNAEVNRAIVFVESAEQELQDVESLPQRSLKAWSALCRSLIAANEFVYID